MTILAPSVLAANWSILETELEKCVADGITHIHFDIMDGNFVPNISFGPKLIHDVRKKFSSLFFDVHLMVSNPTQYITPCVEAGADAITFHIEEENFFYRAVDAIKKNNIQVGLACNPKTPVSAVEELLSEIDIMLVMSVDPGFGGQAFISSTFQKISKLHEIRATNNHTFRISVDGGVSEKNAEQLVTAGADILVMGSAFFSASNTKTLTETTHTLSRT